MPIQCYFWVITWNSRNLTWSFNLVIITYYVPTQPWTEKKWVKSLIQCFNLTLKLWNNANLAVQAQLHRLSIKYRTYWISLKLTKIYAWKDFNFGCLTNLFIIVFTFWNKNKDHYHHYFCEQNILDCTHALIGQKLSCLFCQTHSYFIKALDCT